MILVIEDSEDIRNLLLTLLAHEGYLCVGAPNGETAREIVAASTPRMMIIDRGLPDVDGIALLRDFREDPMLAAVPAIMFSAFGDACKLEALAAGANLFFKKGKTGTEEIVDAVRSLIGPPTLDEVTVTRAEG